MGPVTLAVSSGELEGGLTGQSVHMTIEEAGTKRPANGTPYPTILSLFGDNGSEYSDADIQCS
jgi:hypothetical protein